VFIRALRNIKLDEEITYDYGTDYLKNVIGRSRCQCRRCRRRRARKQRETRATKKRRAARRTRLRRRNRAGR
jgi:SET domain-containing protein